MDSHTPFLAAIRAAPDDDAPRLVYADWLTENGEEERGELIRVQCRLAELPEPPTRLLCRELRRTDRPDDWKTVARRMPIEPSFLATIPLDTSSYRPRVGDVVDLEQVFNWGTGEMLKVPDVRIVGLWEHAYVNAPAVLEVEVEKTEPYGHRDEHARLTTRAVELLNCHAAFWGAELPTPALPQHGHVAWRRGFVDSITCAASDWLAHGDSILERHPVRRVRWTTVPCITSDAGLFSKRLIWFDGRERVLDRLVVRDVDELRKYSPIVAHVLALARHYWPTVAFELPPEPRVTPTRPGDMDMLLVSAVR